MCGYKRIEIAYMIVIKLILLRRVTTGNPDAYIAHGGYNPLPRILYRQGCRPAGRCVLVCVFQQILRHDFIA